MTYAIVWTIQAARARRRPHEEDPVATAELIAAIDSLAQDPRPRNARELGTSGIYRLRVGRCRATYELQGDKQAVRIENVGRLP